MNYKPKHKRPEAWGGSTPRGPKRWARAYSNLLQRPNSQAAKLLVGRIARADQLRTEFSSHEKTPVEHVEFQFNWTTQSYIGEPKRKYATCSLFCAAMVAQLDFGVQDYDTLVRIFQESELVRQLDRATLTRAVQCYCCGTVIGVARPGTKPKRKQAPGVVSAQWAEDVRVWVPGLDPEYDARLAAEWAKDES